MSPDALKKRMLDEFNHMGLLESLDAETSAFHELPRFFEASHLAVQLVLGDVSAMAAASALCARLKRELKPGGVELEYEIRVQWKVVSVDCGALEHITNPPSTAPEYLHAVLESGAAMRSVSIHLSPAALTCVSQRVAQTPPADRPTATRKLIETWITRKLSARASDYWDPVLYRSRDIDELDISRSVATVANSPNLS